MGKGDDSDSDGASIASSFRPGSPNTLADTDGPNVEDPFAFPETTKPPPYATIYPIQKPLAIPQTNPSPDAGFVLAYPPSLLTYGIPESTWLSFISTLSSFLDASVGKHAIRHAGKIAKSTADIPKSFSKRVYLDTVSSVESIGSSAKKGNVFGMIGPVIGLPFAVTGNIVNSVFKIPTAVTQKPQTPRERADAYVEAANKKWFYNRGLHAKIMSTSELMQGLGTSVDVFVGAIARDSETTIQQKLDSLGQWIEELKVKHGEEREDEEEKLKSTTSRTSRKGKEKAIRTDLQIGLATLWLVLVRVEGATETGHAQEANITPDVKT